MEPAATSGPEGPSEPAVTPAPPHPPRTVRQSPLSRRRFLQATATATVAAGAGTAGATASALPAAAEPPGPGDATLSFTASTNGAGTLAPSGDHLVAEVQNTLWSIPRKGGRAVALTEPRLEPTRPQFAPDGKLLAVCAYRDGGFHIWTLRPDGSDLRRRTDGPWDDRGPAWSPDGSRIAFSSERGGDDVTGCPYRIWVLHTGTGELTPVTGLPGQSGPLQDGEWEDFDPAWSPDGARLHCVRGTVAEGEEGPVLRARTVVSVPADGQGAVTTEHTDDSGAEIMAPALSPDGQLAYLRTTRAPAASCTLVVGGDAVTLGGGGAGNGAADAAKAGGSGTRPDLAPVPPRWVSTDKLLLTVDGQFRIVSPRHPDRAEEITFTASASVERPRYRVKDYGFTAGGDHPVRGVHLPQLSPDGSRAVFTALNALWTVDIPGSGRAAAARRPRRVRQADPTHYPLAPAWTPDGRAVVYSDDRDGLFAVLRRDLDSGKETVLASGGRVFPALSPDGTRLACLDMLGNLLVRDLPDGKERILAPPLGAAGLPGRPSWSPDGHRIALCDRNRLNKRFREGYNLIRVVDAGSGDDELHAPAPHTSLSDRYDAGPVWSPDGRHMALVSESALWLLPVRTDGTPDGEPRRLTDESADHPSWSADSRTLLYLSAGRLRRLDVRDGTARTVPVELTYRRPKARETVVHAGRLWDGTGEHVREDVDLLLRDGRISAVEPHRAGRAAARRVDASEFTVIPGLWDSHTHPWQTSYGGRQTATQLAYGITTAVSVGGFAYEQARVRESVASGSMTGPRLLSSGELLDGSRIAYSMGRPHRTRDGLRRSLERAAALDWDFVKTYVRAPVWIMEEAARFAHEELGVRSGSHLCTPGIQAGQDLTTHLQATQRLEYGHATTATGHVGSDVEAIYTGTGFHLVATPFTASALLGADPALAEDPRVTRIMPPWDTTAVKELAAEPPTRDQLTILDRETAFYRRLLRAGGLVALGTDQPLEPVGLHLHLALRALHRAGLTAAQTLRTATVLPARIFGAEADLGTVEEGKCADLALVDGDPFTDFDSLVRTVSVLRGGVPYEQKELVEAFPAPGAHTRAGGRDDRSQEGRSPRDRSEPAEHWREVGRQLRRDGCCSA